MVKTDICVCVCVCVCVFLQGCFMCTLTVLQSHAVRELDGEFQTEHHTPRVGFRGRAEDFLGQPTSLGDPGVLLEIPVCL